MPISDQVIELETKKKGRNILFIVLISVLAAVSVAFAVLWVTKAPAVDPPAIERISVAYTDLSAQGADQDGSPVYTVTPTCTYTVHFDLVLKEGSTINDTNSVVNVISQPAGCITVLSGSGIDPERPNQYVCNFRVNNDVRMNFALVASSEFTPGVSRVIPFKVETDPYTEYFDLGTRDDEVKVIRRDGSTDNDEIKLEKIDARSDDNVTYYRAEKPITYFESPFGSRNRYYRLDFEQLGKLGDNGMYAKIKRNVQGNGGYYDQVKIMVGEGNDYDKVTFTEINADNIGTDNIRFDLQAEQPYCRSKAVFIPRKSATTNYIKLVANNYNGASEAARREIIVEVGFSSSKLSDKITEILFNNPYSDGPVESGKSKYEIDLYLGDGNNSFPLSDFISVKRGEKLEDSEWGTDKLRGEILSGGSGILTNDNSKPFGLRFKSINKSGTDVVRITDSDPDGFDVSIDITVNVHAPIIDVAVSSGNTPQSIEVATFSGNTNTVSAQFTLPNGLRNSEIVSHLNSALTVKYPSGLAPSAVSAPNTISIRNLRTIGNSHVFTPTFTDNATNTSKIDTSVEFGIGANVASGKYEFVFTLAPQGLVVKNDKYVPKEQLSFTVTLTVTRLASSVNVDPDFVRHDKDKYTVLVKDSLLEHSAEATLTLAIGTGEVTGSKRYTVFTLKDILTYYEGDDQISDDGDINYKALKIGTEDVNEVSISEIFSTETGKFVVPSVAGGRPAGKLIVTLRDFTLVLTVEYKMAVESISLSVDGAKPAKFDYSKPSGEGLNLDNDKYDILTAMSAAGAITNAAYMKYPDRLKVDIAYKSGTAAYVFPHKVGRGSATYYFLPGTDLDKATEDDAVFRISKPNDPLRDYGVVLLKDLYSLSVAKGIDYQNIRIYYSYGSDALTVSEDGVVTDIAAAYVVYSDYTFVRKYDDFKLYTDEKYNVELSSGSTLAYTSGQRFAVYYSGIVLLTDGFETPSNCIVEYEDYRYATVGAEMRISDDRHVAYSNGVFTVSTIEGESGVISCGDISYTEKGNSRHTVSVNITVSNTAVSVSSISLYSDAEHNTAFDEAVLYKNGAGKREIKVYYSVTYMPYDNGNTGLDRFIIQHPSNFSIGGASPAIDFDKSPDVYAEELKNQTVLGGCLTLDTDSKVFTYNGYFTVAVLSETSNGDHTLSIYAQGDTSKTDSAVLSVTTVIEGINAGMDVKGKTYSFTAGSAAERKVSFMYDTAAGGINTYDLVFDFLPAGVDWRNLTFKAAFTGADGAGISGKFYSGGNDYESGIGGVTVDGYRVSIPKYRVSGARLTVTVTEKIGDSAAKDYVFNIDFDIDVPVETLALVVDGDDGNVIADGGVLNIVTDGRSGEHKFELSVLVNGGDENLRPIDTAVTMEIEDAGKFAGIYRLPTENGSYALYADFGRVTAPTASLKIALGGRTIRVNIKLTTTKLAISYIDATLGDTLAIDDNRPVDIGAEVRNAGTPNGAALSVQIDYSYGSVTGDIKVSKNGAVFTPSGSRGTFVLTASYSYDNGGTPDTVSVSTVVTVEVPLDRIEIKRDGILMSDTSLIKLLAGQTDGNVFDVAAYYKVSSLPAADLDDADFVCVSSDTTVATVSFSGGKLIVTPAKSGSTVVTVSVDGINAEFIVEVARAKLSLTLSQSEVDVLDTNEFTATVNIDCNGFYDAGDLSVDIGGLNIAAFGARADSAVAGRYYITLDKTKIDAAELKSHTLSVTASIKGVNGISVGASATVTLVAENYEPVVVLTPLHGGKAEIDKSSTGEYMFALAASDKLSGFGGAAPAVTFDCNAFTLVNADNTATISGIKPGYSQTKDTVTATVSFLGNTYEGTLEFAVVDSGSLTSALYTASSVPADIADFISSNGGVNSALLTEVSGNIAIDYSSEHTAKTIVLLTEYTDAPSAVLLADTDSFEVATPSLFTRLGAKTTVKNGRYYFIAYYRAERAGTASFDVRTVAIGGSVYSADSAEITLTASKPNFALNVQQLVLDPGTESTVTVNRNAGFVGDLEYSAEISGNGSGVVTFTRNDNSFKVSAAVDKGGCNAILTVTVSVESGAFKGDSATFTVPVKVNSYLAPTATVTKTVVWSQSAAVTTDLGALFDITHDAHDRGFKAETSFDFAAGAQRLGSITNGVYTPDGNTDGYYTDISYIVTAGGGYFAGRELANGNIRVIVAPSVSLTDGSGVYVAPGGTFDFNNNVEVNNIGSNARVVSVEYALSDPDAGVIENGIFTAANGYAGKVTLTLTATLNYAGGNTGKALPLTRELTVTGLVRSENADDETFKGKNGTVSLVNAFLGAGFTSSAADTFEITSSDTTAVVSAGNGSVRILPDANYGTTDRIVTLSVKITHDGEDYFGTFDFVVQAIAVPHTDVSEGVNGDIRTYTFDFAAGGIASLTAVKGGDLVTVTDNGDNTFTVTVNENIEGGAVELRASVKLGGDYAGGKYENSFVRYFAFTVDNNMPVSPIPVLSVSESDGRIIASVEDTDGNVVAATFGYESSSAYIVLYQDGSYALKKGASGVIAVNVKAVLTEGAYRGEVLNGSVNIKVPDMPAIAVGDVKVNLGENYGGSITIDRSDIKVITYFADSEYIKVLADGKFTFMPASEDKTVTVTVYYTIISGAYSGEICTQNVNVIVPKLPAYTVSVGTESGAEVIRINVPEGSYSADYACALVDVSDSQYITLTKNADGCSWSYKLSTDAYGHEIKLKFTVTFTDGAYSGYTVEIKGGYTVVPPELPVLTVEVDETTQTITCGGATVKDVTYEYDNTYIVIENGVYKFTSAVDGTARAVSVTVKGRVDGGAYDGAEVSATVTVNTPALILDVEWNEDGLGGTVRYAVEHIDQNKIASVDFAADSGSGIEFADAANGVFTVVAVGEYSVNVTVTLDDGAVLAKSVSVNATVAPESPEPPVEGGEETSDGDGTK